MQHQIKEGPLLNSEGNLCEAGFGFKLSKEYKRNDIKACKLRIKEWDYYYIGNNHRGVAFTIDDNSYMGLGSVSILDFDKPSYITKSSMKAFTLGKTNLPSSSKEGTTYWKDKNYELKFVTNGKKRYIDINVLKYLEEKPFSAHFELTETMDDSMVIVTPFEKPKHFYYNQKINCMKANGWYEFGKERYEFSDTDTRAVLDWGRGVWTYKNTWFWGSLSGVTKDNKEIGFNLGYGFGDASAASENMLFYDGKAYKLNDVVFNVPKKEDGTYDYLKPWTFTSSDNSINLDFTPIIDRKDETDVVVIKSLQHQVFGKFNGTITIDGVTAKIEDIVSFAEVVTNWW